MSDYIKRKDALICLPQYPENYTNEQAKNFMNGYYQMWKNVENCAAADVVERKQGYWKTVSFRSPCIVRCSKCYNTVNQEYNFCPNCGAWMRGNSDGN